MNAARELPFCWECGKESYPTQTAAGARIHALHRGEHRHRARHPQASYPCPNGNGWHLTSNRRGGRSRNRRSTA
jgi:hypothetical protein